MNGIKGYISIREASYRWGVSERRVNQYCTEGRIPGASRLPSPSPPLKMCAISSRTVLTASPSSSSGASAREPCTSSAPDRRRREDGPFSAYRGGNNRIFTP